MREHIDKIRDLSFHTTVQLSLRTLLPGLMNEVIEVVQGRINKLTEDLQVIREVRSGKKS